MQPDFISIRGAKQHNLKNISVDIPKNKLVVFTGLSPSISIDQKTTSHNPRSTVGTVTEIYDYLRLLFARIGHPHCASCGREISRQSVEQIVEDVFKLAQS